MKCVQAFFTKRFGLAFEGVPMLETDVNREVDLDREIKASGYFEEEDEQLIERVGQQLLDNACGDNE